MMELREERERIGSGYYGRRSTTSIWGKSPTRIEE